MIIDLKSVSTLTKFLLITMTTVVITNSCLFNSCKDNIYILKNNIYNTIKFTWNFIHHEKGYDGED